MKYWYIAVVALLCFACSTPSEESTEEVQEIELTPESLQAEIKVMEDSLQQLHKAFLDGEIEKIDRLVYHETINRHIAFYEAYPEHDLAPVSVDNIAGLYMALPIAQKARGWRDTLITNYPNYKGIKMALELQVSYYDVDEYNPELLTKYINLLLAQEGLPEEKKEQLNFRLEHIDLTFEELVVLRNPELAQ